MSRGPKNDGETIQRNRTSVKLRTKTPGGLIKTLHHLPIHRVILGI